MSKFIKLTNLIININCIQSIVIKPNKYYILIASNKFDGSKWSFAGFGFGTISSYNSEIASYNSEIEVCETQHSSDYKIVSEWIANH